MTRSSVRRERKVRACGVSQAQAQRLLRTARRVGKALAGWLPTRKAVRP